LLTKKSKKRKRHLRAGALVHPANENLVKRMLGMR
jgi:ribosomal protein L35